MQTWSVGLAEISITVILYIFHGTHKINKAQYILLNLYLVVWDDVLNEGLVVGSFEGLGGDLAQESADTFRVLQLGHALPHLLLLAVFQNLKFSLFLLAKLF